MEKDTLPSLPTTHTESERDRKKQKKAEDRQRDTPLSSFVRLYKPCFPASVIVTP